MSKEAEKAAKIVGGVMKATASTFAPSSVGSSQQADDAAKAVQEEKARQSTARIKTSAAVSNEPTSSASKDPT